jgi:hypothetical protein
MVSILCKSKEEEFEYNFLTICRYLKINKLLEHLNCVQIMGKIYAIFIELSMKVDPFARIKGK